MVVGKRSKIRKGGKSGSGGDGVYVSRWEFYEALYFLFAVPASAGVTVDSMVSNQILWYCHGTSPSLVIKWHFNSSRTCYARNGGFRITIGSKSFMPSFSMFRHAPGIIIPCSFSLSNNPLGA